MSKYNRKQLDPTNERDIEKDAQLKPIQDPILNWLGKDLTSLIESNDPWSWVNFYEEIGRPILDALIHAHTRHVMHRNLKPQNILLRENGSPVITDFWNSKADRRTQTW